MKRGMSGERNLNQLIIINYSINKYKVMGKFQLVVKFPFSPSFKFEAMFPHSLDFFFCRSIINNYGF